MEDGWKDRWSDCEGSGTDRKEGCSVSQLTKPFSTIDN